MADNKKPTDDLLKAMEKFITTKSVVGEPVVVKIVPSAVLVIKDGSSKLISIKDQDGLSRIIDMVPDVVNKFTSKNDVKDDFSDFEEMDEDIND